MKKDVGDLFHYSKKESFLRCFSIGCCLIKYWIGYDLVFSDRLTNVFHKFCFNNFNSYKHTTFGMYYQHPWLWYSSSLKNLCYSGYFAIFIFILLQRKIYTLQHTGTHTHMLLNLSLFQRKRKSKKLSFWMFRGSVKILPNHCLSSQCLCITLWSSLQLKNWQIFFLFLSFLPLSLVFFSKVSFVTIFTNSFNRFHWMTFFLVKYTKDKRKFIHQYNICLAKLLKYPITNQW